MRDIDVRESLRTHLQEKYHGDPDTLIVEELGLCQHEARIDLAVVNGELVGYEIKSDSDTLRRLPNQIDAYNRVFERIMIVCGRMHLKNIRLLVPSWWGISVADQTSESIVIRQVRSAKRNKNVRLEDMIKLIWKVELIDILQRHNITGVSRKRIHELWELAVNQIDHQLLSDDIRNTLKGRKNWRSDQRQRSNGDSRRLAAKSLHSQGYGSVVRILQYIDPQC